MQKNRFAFQGKSGALSPTIKQQMIDTISNPPGYYPYKHVYFCSNDLIGIQYFIKTKDFVPILIGMGDQPTVWINVLGNNKKPFRAVEENIPFVREISIRVDEKQVQVFALEKLILSAHVESQEFLIVDQIDLNPIGLNIIGTDQNLKVGTHSLTHCTIRDLEAAILIE